MKKAVAVAFLAAGFVLLVLGYDAYQSPASAVSRALTGAPTDQAVWLAIGGLLACITGAFGLANPRSNHSNDA